MGMMPQRQYRDVYRSIGDHSAASLQRAARWAGDIGAIRKSVDRLRYLHVPITLVVLRVRETDGDDARRLLCNRLQTLGCAGILPNGDVAMLYLGTPDSNQTQADHVESRVLDLVSRQLMAFVVCGLDVRCFAAFAHLWSDEIRDAPDIVNLATFPPIAMIEIKPATEFGRVAHFDNLS